MTTPALSYLRVSGKGQLTGDGYLRQREAILNYASAHGITLVKEFAEEEAVSGAKGKGSYSQAEAIDRPALSSLLEAVMTSGVKLVLVERSDRLARDLIVGELILDQFRKLGVSVVSVDSGIDLTVPDEEPTKVLIRQILGAVAQFAKSELVLKLRAARGRKKRQTGRCEGRKPFGHKEGEAAHLAYIRQLRQDGLTLKALAERLNVEALPTRAGGRWSAQGLQVMLAR